MEDAKIASESSKRKTLTEVRDRGETESKTYGSPETKDTFQVQQQYANKQHTVGREQLTQSLRVLTL